jgi:Na+/H+-translocating membrane pyrophosphatase
MSDTPEKSAKGDRPEKGEKPGWTGKAALAGAAIGSAALAAALLYASRRKERLEKSASRPRPDDVPETD